MARGPLDQAARDLRGKLLTRLGMDPCKGRDCAPSTAALVCGALDSSLAAVGRIPAAGQARHAGCFVHMVEASNVGP